MKSRKKFIWILLCVAIMLVAFSSIAFSMTGGGNSIAWSALTGGSNTATGGNYVLSSTSGQVLTGEMNGGDYRVTSGFWAVTIADEYLVRLPLISSR